MSDDVADHPAGQSDDPAAGLQDLMAQRPRRTTPLNVRTRDEIRQLVDRVHVATGAQIVEVVEYALLHTYGKDFPPKD